MLRKILLIGIMVVISLIIFQALQRQRFRERTSRQLPPDNQTVARPVPEEGIRLVKYDKDNNPVAEITGVQATQESDRGPVSIVKPTIRILKDKKNITVITADSGRIEGREQDRMEEGWLRGHVVLSVQNKESGDNTVLTCDEMRYSGSEGQIFIPGDMTMRSRSLDVSGSRLTADSGLGSARLESRVRVVLKEAVEGALEKLTGEEKVDTDDKQAAGPREHVVITCDGAVVYRRDENHATFEKNVVASQGENSVRGDGMVVELERKAQEAAEGEKSSGQAMTVRRLIVHSDTKDGVVLSAPGREGQGDRLEYDGRAGIVVFSGSPCRTVQKSGKQTYRLEGNEVRFGRGRLLAGSAQLPNGMNAESTKILVSGAPARVVSIPTEAGQSSNLAGRQILFDQDSRVVWIRGDEQFPARGDQKKNRMTGMEILFFQRTKTQAEKVWGRGPGRLEIDSLRKDTPQTGTQPAFVDFGESMTYLPDGHRAEFTGGVKFTDGATTSRSNVLTVEFAENKESDRMEVSRIVATGGVVVTGEKRSATGEKLITTYPTTGPDTLAAELTAKPGEMCEMKSEELLARSEKIEMVETRTASGKTAVRAKGEGKGFLLYVSKPGPDEAASRPEGFEVHFERSGFYDEAALNAVFEQNVRVRQGDMDLAAGHAAMDLVRERTEATEESPATERLKLRGITATDDVRYSSGSADNRLTVTGKELVWNREKGTADVRGGGPEELAHVVRDDMELDVPVVHASFKDKDLDRAVTTGGGRMTGRTRIRTGKDKGKLGAFDVTWTGDGTYETLEPGDEKTAPTAMVRMEGNVRAVSGDGDVQADVVKVYLGPESEGPAADALKQEVKTAVATGSARAKMFMPEGNYWRHAKGDTLEWDRVQGRMMVMSQTGDAVVWDNSNEWTGRQLVVNRTAEGRVEAESTSGRRITFYDEGTPPSTSQDAREWKPIY